MSFTGRGRDFLKILAVGALWQIPTLGFYRFWLNTRVRRHLWAHTRLGGEAFEYTGTARELLVGFFIAVAISIPLYLAYTIVTLIAEEKQAFAGVPFGVIFLLFGQFALYRARRYRATRTTFRGLRFWMTGSGWNYAFRAAGWFLLMILTLGLALPWAYASLERYVMRHTHYGTLQGDFVGKGRELFRRGIWFWALAVPLPTVMFGAVTWFYLTGNEVKPWMAGLLALMNVVIFGGVVPYMAAITARWRANGLRFGPVALHSDLRPGAFVGTYLKLCLSLLAAFAVLYAVLGLLFVLSGASATLNPGQTPGAGLIVASVLAVLTFSLSLGVIGRYFMQRDMWAILLASLTVSNLSALESVKAAGQASDSVGEGLLDAIDSF